MQKGTKWLVSIAKFRFKGIKSSQLLIEESKTEL